MLRLTCCSLAWPCWKAWIAANASLLALAGLEQAAYKTDVERELAEMEIKNNFNLSAAELELFKEIAIMEGKQANRDFWGNLIANIFGAGATVAGALL